jgi:hypothetical protein
MERRFRNEPLPGTIQVDQVLCASRICLMYVCAVQNALLASRPDLDRLTTSARIKDGADAPITTRLVITDFRQM